MTAVAAIAILECSAVLRVMAADASGEARGQLGGLGAGSLERGMGAECYEQLIRW